MRLALTHAFCWPDVVRGGERYLHEVATALSGRGHDVTIVSTGTSPGRRRENGVRVIRLSARSGSPERNEASFGWRAARLLVSERYDAVHSLGATDAAWSVMTARVRRQRTVYTNLGIPMRSYWDGRFDARAHARVVRDVDVYGCFSRHAADVLQRDYARQGTLTPGGVDLQQFAPTGSRAKEPTLLYCGALDEPRKHVALLLEALALVAEREPSVRLQLCGPGDPSAVLASAPAVARERTELLPPVVPREAGAAELARRYSRAWATVLPATFEAFGMVLVESLACGTPIVATDHAALPELVTPATGALAAPLDAGSLADACACALELSGRPGVGEACRESAAPYDWRTSLAPRLETLYAGEGAE